VKAMIRPLSKFDKNVFKKLLILIVSACEGKLIHYSKFKELVTSELTEETISVIYTGLLRLLKCALRLPVGSLKQELFKEDLQELQIPADFHSDLASVIFGSRREHIDQVSLNTRPRLPQIENFKWRVDVGISTSVLNRVLEPTVLMEMTLTDGNIRTFEVPVSKFHELRYNVAFVLKEMEDLEKRSILKIKD